MWDEINSKFWSLWGYTSVQTESKDETEMDSSPQLSQPERLSVLWSDVADKAYCISIEDCFERRIETHKEFEKVGLTYDYKLVKKDSENPIRGCFSSHHEIISHAYKNNMKRVLVFEDDVTFEDLDIIENSLSNIRHFCDNIDEEKWNVIFLGHSAVKPMYKVGNGMVFCDKGLRLTHALLWSRKGMEEFLKHEFNGNHVDYVIGSMGNNFAPYPMIAYQKDFSTTLTDKKLSWYYLLSKLRDFATQRRVSNFLQYIFVNYGNLMTWMNNKFN